MALNQPCQMGFKSRIRSAKSKFQQPARPLHVWVQTKGCIEVTLPKSATVYAEYLRLRSALATSN